MTKGEQPTEVSGLTAVRRRLMHVHMAPSLQRHHPGKHERSSNCNCEKAFERQLRGESVSLQRGNDIEVGGRSPPFDREKRDGADPAGNSGTYFIPKAISLSHHTNENKTNPTSPIPVLPVSDRSVQEQSAQWELDMSSQERQLESVRLPRGEQRKRMAQR